MTKESLCRYEKHLILEEKSPATVKKYIRDIEAFFKYAYGKAEIGKETVIGYKEHLMQKYALGTANAMLAAINGFFAFAGRRDLRVKPCRQHKKIFRDKSREMTKGEYLRLLKTAERRGNRRLYHIMQTIGATGIRFSELPFITAEAAKSGQAHVRCKGKQRVVLLPSRLRRALLDYCREREISSGPVFVTKGGRPVDRSNIWGEMKRLCAGAGVERRKVFPHNLRHLFAITFYNLDKDIAKLADLLGHASIETTRIYVMESGDRHIRQVEKLGLVV